jgi:hypothetical protein
VIYSGGFSALPGPHGASPYTLHTYPPTPSARQGEKRRGEERRGEGKESAREEEQEMIRKLYGQYHNCCK